MIEFDDSYFEGEEREGFYVEPMMKRAWAAQMEVLQVIAAVCKEHNIQYYADWGTMLGAVRHKGFVPWDDDMDIAMKRPDYMKFLQIAKEELPEGFSLLNIHTEDDFDSLLTRVLNSRFISFNEEHLNRYHGCPYAVGIDIFPLDYIPNNKDEETLQREMIRIVLNAAGYVVEKKHGNENIDNNELESMLIQIEELCGITLQRDETLDKQLYNLGEQLCGLYGPEDSSTLTSMVDFSNGWEYRIKKESYDKVIDMPFENITMPVPVGYDEILTTKYGDYMVPVKGITNHDYPFYKKQKEVYEQKIKEMNDGKI